MREAFDRDTGCGAASVPHRNVIIAAAAVICESDEIADLLDELRGASAQIRGIRKGL